MAEIKGKTPRRLSIGRGWKLAVGVLVAFVLLVTGLSYLVKSDMLRRYIERQANSRLKGYTLQVGSAYFHPFSFTLDLRDLALIQDANPKPPVVSMKSFYATVHWRELLSARLVGDMEVDRPRIYIDRARFEEEKKSKVPLKKKGWQDALESIYPLKVNVFRIINGEVTYVEEKFPPLRISSIQATATNIRNIQYPARDYPSPLHVEATVFDKGRLTLDGNANFLSEPHATVKSQVKLADMGLGFFKPITDRENILLEKGALSAEGWFEYGAKDTVVDLKKLTVTGVGVTYVHHPKTTGAEKKRVAHAGKTAAELSNEPSTRLRADQVRIEKSTFSYVDRTTKPNYRLFIDDAELTVKDFSNQLSDKPAAFELKGKFMGSGRTEVTGSFTPKTKTPDLRLAVRIDDTQMVTMSDLFRVYGNFDIKGGLFSLYSEVTVKGKTINGYVKPLFRDMQVADRRTDKEKGIFHRLYIAGLKVASKLLKNKPRQEVATQVDISGTLDNPQTSIWQIIGNLVRNAFFKAILPGFEREAKPEKG